MTTTRTRDQALVEEGRLMADTPAPPPSACPLKYALITIVVGDMAYCSTHTPWIALAYAKAHACLERGTRRRVCKMMIRLALPCLLAIMSTGYMRRVLVSMKAHGPASR